MYKIKISIMMILIMQLIICVIVLTLRQGLCAISLSDCVVEPMSKVDDRYYIQHKISENQFSSVFQAFNRNLKSDTLYVLRRMKGALLKRHYCLQKEMSSMRITEELVEVFLDSNNQAVFVYKSSYGMAISQYSNYTFQPQEILKIVYRLLQKLVSMHEKGLYHGQIGPNTVLVREKPNFDVFLWDFHNGGNNQTIANITNMSYIPPQAITTGKLSPAADMWATGNLISKMFNKDMLSTNTSQDILKYHTKRMGLTTENSGIGIQDKENGGQLQEWLKVRMQSKYTQWKPLISGLLQKDPTKRLTANQAISSEIFRSLFNPTMFRELIK